MPHHRSRTFFGLSAFHFRQEVNVQKWKEISRHWTEAPGKAKQLITQFAVNMGSLILPRRPEMDTLKDLQTGHCPLS